VQRSTTLAENNRAVQTASSGGSKSRPAPTHAVTINVRGATQDLDLPTVSMREIRGRIGAYEVARESAPYRGL
jgi:hypothetical protein